MSSSAAGPTRRRLGNTSTCPHGRFDIEKSHHQLYDALNVGLATKAPVHTCVLTHKKVIIAAGRTIVGLATQAPVHTSVSTYNKVIIKILFDK